MGNLGDLGFSSFAAIGGAKEQHSSKATADDLSQYFRFEDGKWREATEGERISWCRDSIRAGLVTEMSGIKTYMDAMEIGGAAVASLPAILAAGSLEVGGAALIYGEGALTSIASTSGTVAGYSVSLGDALTIGGATWLLGTESGHEYVRQVGSSGLPTAQTAALVGVDAVAGMLSKGEATTTYVSEALDASSAKATTQELNTATTWGRAETLADHFGRHGADFGAQTADEYANMASRFLQESQAAKLPTKIDSQGVIRVFDSQTGAFGSFNPNGTTRTFYKPNSPTYFDRQPGALVP